MAARNRTSVTMKKKKKKEKREEGTETRAVMVRRIDTISCNRY
jgi:hypothetical protein